MKFSKLETNYLKRLASMQEDAGPTFLRMARLSLPSWLLLIIFVSLGTVCLEKLGLGSWGLLLIGLGAGAILRDVGWFRKSLRLWPLQKEIFNWPRVKQLAAEAERSQDPRSTSSIPEE